MVAVIALALVGFVVGTFLTVLVDRVPGREPLTDPLAALSIDGERPAGLDLVPLVGTVAALGTGRGSLDTSWFGPDPLETDSHDHGAPGPRVRLGLELATAVSFGALAWRFGADPVILPYLVAAASLVAVSAIDLAYYRIPDLIVFPTLAACLVLIGAISISWGAADDALTAVVGGLGYFLFLFIAHLISPRGMGMGDVKLALVLGLILGWISPALVLLGLLVSCLIGSVVGAIVLAVRRRNSGFPFGPSLAGGTMLAVVAHPQLLALVG